MKSVIVIAGVPRSGTSWLGQIVESSPDVAYRFQPLFSYAFKEAVNEDSTAEEHASFFEALYQSTDDFLLQTDKRQSGEYPLFERNATPAHLAFKTCRYQYVVSSMLERDPRVKLVGIVRHPCGTINSWLQNPKEFPAGSEPRREWRVGACKNQGRPEEFFGFYKWKEVAHLYLDLRDRFPERVHLVRYGELVEETEEVAGRLFRFLDLEMTEQTLSFLQASHSRHTDSLYGVFKGKWVKDRWQSELDPEIAEEILREVRGTRLEWFLR